MVGLEPAEMSHRAVKAPILALLALLGFLFAGTALSAQELAGAWVSPDWYLPGGRSYSEADVRKATRKVLAKLVSEGVDTVFLETFLRGTSICPTIDETSGTLRVLAYPSTPGSFPVYPHFMWSYSLSGDSVGDPLQIFIDEAQQVGIAVHAWIHMYYWRMDNNDIMLSWHNGPSIWAELMADYLLQQVQVLSRVSSSPRQVSSSLARTPLSHPQIELVVKKAADIFSKGCDVDDLTQVLKQAGFRVDGHPLNVLLRSIFAAGGERPSFLLASLGAEPFPAYRGKPLRSVYVNPENPEVRRRLLEVIRNIAWHHPGLAGIHLDHIRYPVDGQGLSRETGVIDGSYHAYSASSQEQLAEYATLNSELAQRRSALQTIVSEVRAELPPRMVLSAAVLPLYYRDRDQGKFRTSGYDYSAQAWLDWPVDFVVPMLYEYPPYVIRSLTKDYQALAYEANPSHPMTVFPGISRLRYTRDGSVDPGKGWVYFDLSLARDVSSQAREMEDLDFDG